MKKTYADFFRDLNNYANDCLGLPTSTAHDLTIDKDGLKVTVELTKKLMKELVSKCVYIYGLEDVVKAAVESVKETE